MYVRRSEANVIKISETLFSGLHFNGDQKIVDDDGNEDGNTNNVNDRNSYEGDDDDDHDDTDNDNDADNDRMITI